MILTQGNRFDTELGIGTYRRTFGFKELYFVLKLSQHQQHSALITLYVSLDVSKTVLHFLWELIFPLKRLKVPFLCFSPVHSSVL